MHVDLCLLCIIVDKIEFSTKGYLGVELSCIPYMLSLFIRGVMKKNIWDLFCQWWGMCSFSNPMNQGYYACPTPCLHHIIVVSPPTPRDILEWSPWHFWPNSQVSSNRKQPSQDTRNWWKLWSLNFLYNSA